MARWGVSTAVVLVVATVAVTVVVQRFQAPAPSAAEPILYTVALGTVGREDTYAVEASWKVHDVVFSTGSGVVTEVAAPAGRLESGKTILRLNERPMVVITSEIPAYRPMGEGDTGRDVLALRKFLADEGLLANASDVFDSATALAVAGWQSSLGIAPSGRVELGDVLLVPNEANGEAYRLAAGVRSGASIAPREPVLELLGAEPELVVQFGGSADNTPPVGTHGVLELPGGSTDVQLSSLRTAEGRLLGELRPSNSSSLCAIETCLAWVPAAEGARFAVRLATIPEARGPVVPVAAIQTDAAGMPFVVLADGTRRFVDVLVATGGLAVVSGIEPRAEVRLSP